MQCKPVTALPTGEKWTFEIKFDAERVTIEGGDFFERVPSCGDAYLLSHISMIGEKVTPPIAARNRRCLPKRRFGISRTSPDLALGR